MSKTKSNDAGLPADRENRVLPGRSTQHETWAPLKGSGYEKDFPQKPAQTAPGSQKIVKNPGNGSW